MTQRDLAESQLALDVTVGQYHLQTSILDKLEIEVAHRRQLLEDSQRRLDMKRQQVNALLRSVESSVAHRDEIAALVAQRAGLEHEAALEEVCK